jgi:hypothetical protein
MPWRNIGELRYSSLHAFLTSQLNGGEWSASPPGHFTTNNLNIYDKRFTEFSKWTTYQETISYVVLIPYPLKGHVLP